MAQWVKRWPTDLAVPSSIPARGGNLASRKRWMDGCLAILRPFQKYFSHIRTIRG